MNIIDFFSFTQFLEYGYSLFIINIIFYIFLLLLIFSIFFLFDLSSIKTLSDLKNFNTIFFINFSLVLCLLSLAGIPPLSGFAVKFLTFMFLFLSSNYLVIFYFALINFFFLFFYVQNIRLLISTNNSESTKLLLNFHKKNSLNSGFLNIIIFLNFFNLAGIFFLEDILLYFNYIFSFMFIS